MDKLTFTTDERLRRILELLFVIELEIFNRADTHRMACDSHCISKRWFVIQRLELIQGTLRTLRA